MAGDEYDNVERSGSETIPSVYDEIENLPSYHEIDPKKRKAEDDLPKSSLSHCQRFCYGVGHVLNDLAASMWFSYLLVFLHNVSMIFFLYHIFIHRIS